MTQISNRSDSAKPTSADTSTNSSSSVLDKLKGALSTLVLGVASVAGGGEVQESHAGSCGCPGCLPPPRVSLENKRKDDEAGEAL